MDPQGEREKGTLDVCVGAKPVTTAAVEAIDAEHRDSRDWPSHPQNPVNWSLQYKYAIVVLISLTNVTSSVCATAFEPAIPIMLRDFGSSSSSLPSLTITAFLLGYVLGPLLIAPMSELYGRVWTLWPAYVLFIVTLVLCGTTSSLTTFIVVRCFMGFAANAFVIVGPAIVADIISKDQRGLALSVLLGGPILGPTLGPLLGGLIVQGAGWRWIFWVALIILVTLFIISLFILRETYPLVAQHRHLHSLRHQRSRFHISFPRLPHSTSEKSTRTVLGTAFIRPLKLFFLVPVIPLLALYTSASYTYLQILFATLGTVYQAQYGFTPRESGLVYLGMMVGFVIALVSTGLITDRLTKYLAMRRAVNAELQHGQNDRSPDVGVTNGTSGDFSEPADNTEPSCDSKALPEERLPFAIFGSILIVPAILTYGFTLQYSVHWIVPLVATAIISCSAIWTYMATSTYLVDAYGIYAASATGAVSIFRAICASLVPLAANPAYDRLGYGWGNAVFAFVCVLFIPMAIGLMFWGTSLRQRFKVGL